MSQTQEPPPAIIHRLHALGEIAPELSQPLRYLH
jgi:hypothetical protein